MPDAERPNVVLFVTDTQGLNAVGAVGGTGDGVVDTPAIDGLASAGVAFENAYCTAPVCTPSRSGLLSGCYPHGAGAWTNNLRYYRGIRELGEYFDEAGYRTAYVGKYHLDGDYFGDGVAPDHYEQEYWYDGQNYREDVGEAFWEWYRSGMREPVSEPPVEAVRERDITREDTWGGGITERARAFLDDVDGDQPYFLVVSYDEPHEPSLCPAAHAEPYVDEPYPLPDNYETLSELAAHDKPDHHREWARDHASGDAFIDSLSDAGETGVIRRPMFFGCAEFVDAEIGRVLEAVDAREDDTVTVFTSDHGHHLGAHGIDMKGRAMYDETTNVPLVVRYPGVVPEGDVAGGVASLVDLTPTLLAVAGIDVPDGLDGRSMWPTLRDPERAYREAALVEYHSYARGARGGGGINPIRCLVTDEHKLVVNLFHTDELYDLHETPHEVYNHVEDPDYAGVRDELFADLRERMSTDGTNDPFDGDVWDDRHWRGE
jgi:uncharacterized sulfatase